MNKYPEFAYTGPQPSRGYVGFVNIRETDTDSEFNDPWDDGPKEDDEDDGAAECGRWRNGRLDAQCLIAGSEECDWDCPIGLERKTWP